MRLLLILYSCYLIASLYFKYGILEKVLSPSLVLSAIKISIEHIIRMSQVLPMALIYFGVGIVSSRHLVRIGVSGWGSNIAKLSFSIYILQEFILRILYYKTCFCEYLGPLLYPWCGFVLTFFISYLLGYIFNHNKISKIIIG